MGWETRRGSYYTRSRRVGGKVVRQYLGAGLVGQIGAHNDTRARIERTFARVEAERQEEAAAGVDATVRAAVDFAEALARAALLLAGCHRHERGEWRRKRGHEEEP